MGKRATIVTRIAITSALSASLGGCGYRELKAPCGPEEGKPAAMSYAPVVSPPVTGSPLDQLGVASIPVADPCGPLRPLNGARSVSGDP
jgi:hypothetical protein